MRASLIPVLVLGFATIASAGTVTLTFSGVFASTCPAGSPAQCATSLGLVHDGDTFSGTATWDPATVGASIPNFAILTSLSFTGPVGEGLSGTLASPNITFGGAQYVGGNFSVVQINDRSTVDNTFYVFDVGAIRGVGCTGPTPICAASVSNAAFTSSVFAKSYATTLTPEPSTLSMMIGGLGLAFLLLKRGAIALRK